MVEKYNIRTDLALEEKERFESDHVEVQGVILTEEYDEENEIRITTVRIETGNSLENCFLKERWKRSWWSVLAIAR